MWWTDLSGRIELQITKNQAASCSHAGQCDLDVKILGMHPKILKQLIKLHPSVVSACLAEYGAWNEEELSDHDQNLDRLLWIACCDIAEQNF
jgi:hypothetical protein